MLNWLDKNWNNIAIDEDRILYRMSGRMRGNVLEWKSVDHKIFWETCDCSVNRLISTRFSKYE